MRIGEYEVERELGRGGMGVVYAARHLRLGRRVALKVLLNALDPRQAERFRLEAVSVAQLDHPNIVRVHEVGVADGRAFFAMELVVGEPLADRLARDGPLEPRQAAVLVEALARAVAHAHERGVLHRDLKPSNVLLTPQERPLLTDFGLARELSDARERLTRTGEIVGTPSYMPPEQADGDAAAIGPGCDVYGLGATLYALLCGRPPFSGESLPVLLAQILTQAPEPPRALRPELDPDIEAVCLRALAKRPADRYPSAEALADDLLAYLHGDPISSRRSRPRAAVIAGALAVGVAAVAASLALERGARPAPTSAARSPEVTALPSPAATRSPATPFVAPERFRLDWRGSKGIDNGPGEWHGGFLPGGDAIAHRRGDRRAWRIRGPKDLSQIDLGAPCRAFTLAGDRLIVLRGRALTQLAPRPERILLRLEPEWTVEQLTATPDGRTLGLAKRSPGRRQVRLVLLDADGGRVRRGRIPPGSKLVTVLRLDRWVLVGVRNRPSSELGAGNLYRTRLEDFPAGGWSPADAVTGYPTAAAFDRDGRLATGTSSGHAYLYDRRPFARPSPILGSGGILGFTHGGAVRGLAFSADGRRLYTAAGELNRGDGELAVWDLTHAPPTRLELLKKTRAVRSLALSPDQRRLLVVTQQGPELWSVPRP